MDTQNQRSTNVLCDRHKIRITKLNIGEDCSLNKRTICSQCLNVEKTIQLTELDRIVQMNLTEVRNDLKSKKNKFEQQKETLIQYLDLLSEKYEQEYQNILAYYNYELFQDILNNDKVKLIELQLLAERLVTRLDKFNKLQITSANLKPINQLNDILLNLIENMKIKIKDIVKFEVFEIKEVENKHVSFEKLQTITNLDIRNVNCICTNRSQNYILLTGEGADKIIQYEFEDGEWQPTQVISEKEIYFIDHHPLLNQFVCCNFKQKSIKIYQQIDNIWSEQGNLNWKMFELPRAKYNHDGSLIATTDESLQIQFWKYDSGSYSFQSHIDSYHTRKIRVLEFNHNSSLLASGSWDSTIHIYINENEQWRLHQRLRGHTSLVNGLCFKNEILSSCSDDKTILIWMKQGSEFYECIQNIPNHTDFVTCIDFNRDSSIFVSGSSDHTIRVWRRDKNQKEYQLEFLHRQVESTRIKSIKILESNIVVAGDLKNAAFIYQLKM